MEDFPGLLARDFGFRPQGKSAPMAASKATTTTATNTGPLNFGIGSDSDTGRSSKQQSSWNSTPLSFLDDQDGIFGRKSGAAASSGGGVYDDVFGGPPKYSANTKSSTNSSFDVDSFFQKDAKLGGRPSSPVFDKPVYDDDIFDGVPGLKSSSSFKYEDDVFSSISSPPKRATSTNYGDDLLGNLARKVPPSRKKSGQGDKKDMSSFDDLLPGFGGSPQNRTTSETSGAQKANAPSTKSASSVMEDPFVVLGSPSVPAYTSSGLFSEPLEQTDKHSNIGSIKSDVSSSRGGIFDDVDPLSGLGRSVPKFSGDINNRAKDGNNSKTGISMTHAQNSLGEEPIGKDFTETAPTVSGKQASVEDYRESHQTLFDMPSVSSDSQKVYAQNGSRTHPNASPSGTNSQAMSPKSEDNTEPADDIWLTVSEIPLFTQPSIAPPPSRPPPPRPAQASKTVKGSFSTVNSKKVNEFSSFKSFSQSSWTPEPVPDSAKSSGMSSMDELEEFAMGRRQSNADEQGDSVSSEEDAETNSAAAASAAAMKEAMDRAEAKFKHAREVRERESAKVVRNRVQQGKDEKVMQDIQERDLREKQDREREHREREEKEREQRKLEKERERAREIEREKARQAVERATKEARERAAAEARQRAERAAVEKAKGEARERAERAAVQRAHAEARERAATEAKERAERAAADAKERANAEAREKAAAVARAEAEARRRTERIAVDRAAAEARERAAQEAREKATAAAAAGRGSQQRNENDLESFFGMPARANSAPRSRTSTSDSTSHPQFNNRPGPEGSQWQSTGTSSNMKKANSIPNIVDDLTSIFGAPPSSGDFQNIDGETEERRRARLERHQRTQDRAKKALAEKNERDLQNQRDQAERDRIGETLDVEIKRWAAGKDGNLRALLSTLQYVLWPECGWQPVSLTDLITGNSVKKVYRKATLCIHPDKVQQKGANLQQKYIAEKVFDLLKEAWNKFNSEELF